MRRRIPTLALATALALCTRGVGEAQNLVVNGDAEADALRAGLLAWRRTL